MSLLIHTKDGAKLSREGIGRIATPPPQGNRHRPVPHLDVINNIEAGLERRGMRITKEDFGVSGDTEIQGVPYQSTNLFGTFDVEPIKSIDVNNYSEYTEGPRGSEFGFTLGFRSSNSQKFALQMVAGATVFVCDNMVLSGEDIMRKLHTLNLDLIDSIDASLDGFMRAMPGVVEEIERQKNFILNDDRARSVMFKLFEGGALPFRMLKPMAGLYFEPTEDMTDVTGRNLFGLQSAATRILRDEPVNRRLGMTEKLARALRSEIVLN